MKRRTYQGSIDYGHHPGFRKKLAHYLKAGSFKHIAGNIVPAKRTRRNRLILVILAIIVTIIGLYHAIL
ncbi:MAG TPA: hypothetical protein PK821_04480 [Victivallales bacterium]|nr:hypothetical protein [Victivallales bacterium]